MHEEKPKRLYSCDCVMDAVDCELDYICNELQSRNGGHAGDLNLEVG